MKQEYIINCLITAQHVRSITKFIQENKKVNPGNSIDKLNRWQKVEQ